jgi:hypothetical protein
MYRIGKLKLKTWFGFASVIGFMVIFITSIYNINLTAWADSITFIFIGFGLFLVGGINFFRYFSDGKITMVEINRLITVLVGLASVVLGVMIAPFLDYQLAIIPGIKAVISAVAIGVTVMEIYQDQNGR